MDFALLHNLVRSPFVYVHYPLCRHTCSYCDFNVYTESRVKGEYPDFEERWLRGIERDLRGFNSQAHLKTLYWGGGTPSLMSEPTSERLVATLKEAYRWDELDEFSLECNPESLSYDKLKLFKDLGVNRPSLGIQTFQESSLKRLERLATYRHLEDALEWVQSLFKNFSVDLMIATPGQDMNSLRADLERIAQLQPPHISVYMLTLKPDHVYRTHPSLSALTPTETVATQMYLEVCGFLKSQGYEHYEVSNFAKPGFRSRHNSNYWDINSSYLGVGPGAHGYSVHSLGQRFRYERIRDPRQWMESPSGVAECEPLSAEQTALEEIYMKLRTRRPILPGSRPEIFDRLVENELMIQVDDQGFIASDRGWLVMEGLAEQIIAAVA